MTWNSRAKFAQVILGAHNLYESTNQPNYVTMKVEKFYDHPDYEATSIVNDVALIELPTDVQYTGKISQLSEITWLYICPTPIIDDVRPACLPLKSAINKDITGVQMVAAGWGKINDSELMCH